MVLKRGYGGDTAVYARTTHRYTVGLRRIILGNVHLPVIYPVNPTQHSQTADIFVSRVLSLDICHTAVVSHNAIEAIIIL